MRAGLCVPVPKGPNDGLHFNGCVGKNHLLICAFFVCDLIAYCASFFFDTALRLLCFRISLFCSACFFGWKSCIDWDDVAFRCIE